MIRITASKFICLAACLLCVFRGSAEVRIVSLAPSVTETIVKLGGAELLVGRSSACTMPAVKHLPVAGALGLPFPEKLLRLRPTHVITDVNHPSAAWKLLKENGISIELLPAEKLADYPRNVRKIGALLHRTREAENEAENFEKLLAECRAAPAVQPQKVLIVFAVQPVVSCGKNSFVSELVELAGGENIAGKLPFSYLPLSSEFILRSAPEVILCCMMPQQSGSFFRRPPFSALPAVRQNRIITEFSPDSVCRPGPNLADTLRRLRRKLIFLQ